MKQKWIIVLAFVLILQTSAFCEPQRLNDDELDEINAGTVYDAGILELLMQAQLDLSSLVNLNTVNSSNMTQINLFIGTNIQGGIHQSNHAVVNHDSTIARQQK